MIERAIITGASEGLGYELSKLLIEDGFEVIGLSRNKPDIGINHIKLDLTNENEIVNVINIIKNDYSEFQYFINCAGVLSINPINDINHEESENLFKVNVLAPMKLVSGLFDLVRRNEADIVNVGSTVGYKAYENQTAYVTSKWAMRGFTKNLQLELRDTKCRVIGFNPGGFKSRIFEKATGNPPDLTEFMDPNDIAQFLVQILKLPKNMEVSEVVINRK